MTTLLFVRDDFAFRMSMALLFILHAVFRATILLLYVMALFSILHTDSSDPTRLLHVFHVMILSHTALHLSRSSFVCYFGRERENPNKGTRGGERIPWKNRKKMKIGSWQIPWGLILYKSCRNRQLPLLVSGARFTRADIENCIV